MIQAGFCARHMWEIAAQCTCWPKSSPFQTQVNTLVIRTFPSSESLPCSYPYSSRKLHLTRHTRYRALRLDSFLLQLFTTTIMADEWRSENQQALEDNGTTQTNIDQNLPDHVVNPETHLAPTDRQIIDVKLVNRLQGRPFMACCRRWQGTTGQMLAEIARALRLGVYELYSLEVTAEYIYGFVKMEGSRAEMRAAHPKNTPTFPECM